MRFDGAIGTTLPFQAPADVGEDVAAQIGDLKLVAEQIIAVQLDQRHEVGQGLET